MGKEAENSSVQTSAAPLPSATNPTPLGFCAFGLTTFVLSCYNTGSFGVGKHDPINVVVGMALYYGGIGEILAGMWEFKVGNTFGGTVFTSYGAFWLSFAVIYIPGFGILEPYLTTAPEAFHSATAIYFLGWTIFTMMMLLCTLRTSISIIALFSWLSLTFLLLTMSRIHNQLVFSQIAGYTGIITAIISWYNSLAGLLTNQNSYFTLPVGKIGPRS
eukprot:c39129_g1_i1 orf=193-843(-)